VDEPLLARVVSPNLTIAAREYTDAELERIIRHGIRPDGRSVVVMPSGMFSVLDDADLGRIIAYVRSVPPVPGRPREVRIGPLARLLFALGKFEPAAAEVSRAVALSASYPSGHDPMARGAYLARTACTECHGLDLRGGDKAPDLRIAAGYSRDAFAHLMRTGKGLGDRELPLMSRVARRRFSHFTDNEIGALHDYLLARAAASGTSGPKAN
jgi:mono/diheme cytochrome c family protein